MAIQIKNTNFQTEVLEAEGKVLVDFYATWCMPCKLLSPVLSEVEKELKGVKIYKVDIDKAPELAMEYDVMSIPTLVVFQEGTEVQRVVGVRSKDEIIGMLQ